MVTNKMELPQSHGGQNFQRFIPQLPHTQDLHPPLAGPRHFRNEVLPHIVLIFCIEPNLIGRANSLCALSQIGF